MLFTKFFAAIYNFLEKAECRRKDDEYRKRFNIHKKARLGYLPNIVFRGNIEIKANSYFNSGKITTGPNSKVVIGEWCAIGYNVNIMAITHDIEKPTGPYESRPKTEGDIIIGDKVWIGSNVFIREGVKVGNNSVIGANSVVTKDIPDNAIVGGIPAKIIRFKSGK